jgi:hypothetical protein
MADEKPFDCVQFQRQARARISRELAKKTPEERVRWIREQAARYATPPMLPVQTNAGKE